MDFGYHNSVRCMMLMYQSIHTNLRYSHQTAIESIAKCLSHLDAQTDKQKFLELNNASFMLPKKFEFQPFRGDEVSRLFFTQIWGTFILLFYFSFHFEIPFCGCASISHIGLINQFQKQDNVFVCVSPTWILWWII